METLDSKPILDGQHYLDASPLLPKEEYITEGKPTLAIDFTKLPKYSVQMICPLCSHYDYTQVEKDRCDKCLSGTVIFLKIALCILFFALIVLLIILLVVLAKNGGGHHGGCGDCFCCCCWGTSNAAQIQTINISETKELDDRYLLCGIKGSKIKTIHKCNGCK